MKILAITDSYPPHHSGGYELRSKDIFEGLRKRGHDLSIISSLCPDRKCQMHADEPYISRTLHHKNENRSLLKRIFFDLLDMRFIDHRVKEFKPDLIYLSHLGNLASPIFFHFSVRQTPIVFDDGGLGMVFVARILKKGLYFYNKKNEPLLKTWLKKILNCIINIVSKDRVPKELKWPQNSKIIFNNFLSMNNAKENGVPVEGAKVIYSGVDTNVFKFQPRTTWSKPLRIILPGRIEPQKGTKDAISLLQILKNEDIDVLFTIVGNIDSITYYDEIKNMIAKLNLQDFVRILPMVKHEELSLFYRESEICFFPSNHKSGLSRVPLEAMASGSLIISYGNEGSNEIIQNNKTGFLIPEGDIQSCVDIIKDLQGNPEVYKQIIQNARKAVEEMYSITAYVDKIESFLRQTVQII